MEWQCTNCRIQNESNQSNKMVEQTRKSVLGRLSGSQNRLVEWKLLHNISLEHLQYRCDWFNPVTFSNATTASGITKGIEFETTVIVTFGIKGHKSHVK